MIPTPTGEKEYWHDKRLGTARAAASAPRPGLTAKNRQTAGQPGSHAFTVRTYPNLRHPIAAATISHGPGASRRCPLTGLRRDFRVIPGRWQRGEKVFPLPVR